MSLGYKPSPLGGGGQFHHPPTTSARNSPFRRPSPDSPASPSTVRHSPSASPAKTSSGTGGLASTRALFESHSSKSSTANNPSSPAFLSSPAVMAPLSSGSSTPRPLPTPRMDPRMDAAPQMSPPRSPMGKGFGAAGNNALSQLQPAQVRMMREGFQILDRDSDGVVGRDDVADMLNQLGLPSTHQDISEFFPPSTPQTTTLPAFLNSLATVLAALAPAPELLSAFSAFDDDDNGQVDVAELRDALLHTAPEQGERPLSEVEIDRVMNGFTSRRAFNKHMTGGLGKRGEIFKYQGFVSSIQGGNGSGEQKGGSEDGDEQ